MAVAIPSSPLHLYETAFFVGGVDFPLMQLLLVC